MHRFFASPDEIKGGIATLSGDEAHHLLRVLRLTPGTEIEVLDGTGHRYAAKVYDGGAQVKLLHELSCNEPKTRITLYQGLPKLDKMDGIIQKCVEIGVYEIVPVLFSRCVSRPDKGKKSDRYNRIAREATKQCVRGYVPRVLPVMDLNEAIAHMSVQSLIILPWEEACRGDIRKICESDADGVASIEKIGVIIGPEGGITPEEAEKIQSIPTVVRQVTLGPRILRTETAGPAVLAIILTLLGDMGGE